MLIILNQDMMQFMDINEELDNLIELQERQEKVQGCSTILSFLTMELMKALVFWLVGIILFNLFM